MFFGNILTSKIAVFASSDTSEILAGSGAGSLRTTDGTSGRWRERRNDEFYITLALVMYALEQFTMIRFRHVRREEANGGQGDAARFEKFEDHGKAPSRPSGFDSVVRRMFGEV